MTDWHEAGCARDCTEQHTYTLGRCALSTDTPSELTALIARVETMADGMPGIVMHPVPAALRDRVGAAVGKAIDDDPMDNLTDLAGHLTEAVLTALLATGPDREHRIPLADLTAQDLAGLYDDLDRYAEILGEMNEQLVHLEQRASRAEDALAETRRLHRETCPLARGDVHRPAFTCGICDALDPPAPAATEATDTTGPGVPS